ncbi:hypothetical protein EVAR_37243_1 [Eumeta japonica]|uniref:Uncharacterized protein n=1 Tax=Eumeta variegata TaxID=151549 RepID=A0A4C1Y5F7_EUMVA|nr:hypothetical protein EVAR_37243_1 [Eumeta japonica]
MFKRAPSSTTVPHQKFERDWDRNQKHKATGELCRFCTELESSLGSAGQTKNGVSTEIERNNNIEIMVDSEKW